MGAVVIGGRGCGPCRVHGRDFWGKPVCGSGACGAVQALQGAVPCDVVAVVEPTGAGALPRAVGALHGESEVSSGKGLGRWGPESNADAQQALSGVGCQNPDCAPGETKGGPRC